MDDLVKSQSENQEQSVDDSKPANIEKRIRSHGNESWLIGIILVLLGVVFLLQNMTGFSLDNWWALFILIPAFKSFSRGWQAIQETGGTITSRARGNFLEALVLIIVTTILLFDLDWVIFGPYLLIAAGVALLLNSLLSK